MVKTKHQKSKPHKTPKVKQQGKQADLTLFRDQLDGLGLKIIQVTADVYRSLADQLAGNEEEHEKYRSMVVQYIRKNREIFEPFLEDDVPFEEYCQQMEKDGTWAGHMELQAASLVTNSNICIHRVGYYLSSVCHLLAFATGEEFSIFSILFRVCLKLTKGHSSLEQYTSPRWYIQNFDQRGAHMVHLSYHDEEHYNSVRSKQDTCDGPARMIVIKADVALSQGKAASGKSKGSVSGGVSDSGSIKLVMAGSGCEDTGKVEEVLLEVHGDVGAAIEYLIAERESADYSVDNGFLPCQVDMPSENQGDEDGNCNHSWDELSKKTSKHEPSGIPIEETTKDGSSKTDAKIPRNKVCPCGSKKKYKSCCGTAKGRSSSAKIIRFALWYPTKRLRLDVEGVERTRNKGIKEGMLNPCLHADLKMGHLTWVHFVYEDIEFFKSSEKEWGRHKASRRHRLKEGTEVVKEMLKIEQQEVPFNFIVETTVALCTIFIGSEDW
ncbi:OVARIAN TUMOR DOMAIN-containing deubiquitinating enzyme 7 [Linum perenne]